MLWLIFTDSLASLRRVGISRTQTLPLASCILVATARTPKACAPPSNPAGHAIHPDDRNDIKTEIASFERSKISL